MKKVISLLMALTMLLSLLPVGALADEAVTGPVEAEAVVIEQATEELEEAEESAVSEQAFEEHAEKTEAEPGSIIAEGTCGENLTWVLDSEGTLTISGTGAMEDYSDGESMIETPWFESLESIK